MLRGAMSGPHFYSHINDLTDGGTYLESPSPSRTLAAIEKAKADGFIIHRSKPNLLLLDLDTKKAWFRFLDEGFRMLNDTLAVLDAATWKSKSGNRHVKVTVEGKMPVLARFAYQAALGSDPRREFLGVILHQVHSMRDPSVLFQPPGSKVTQVWEHESRRRQKMAIRHTGECPYIHGRPCIDSCKKARSAEEAAAWRDIATQSGS